MAEFFYAKKSSKVPPNWSTCTNLSVQVGVRIFWPRPEKYRTPLIVLKSLHVGFTTNNPEIFENIIADVACGCNYPPRKMRALSAV